jgi:hypothetical protein
MRRNLIIVRAGDESLHEHWLDGRRARNFELFVSYYGERSNAFAERADEYEARSGMKWPRLYELWRLRRDWLLGYDAIWFPDDDLLSDCDNISTMFELFHEHGLCLAQPALARGSFVAHPITARVEQAKLRFTNFVEVMCPIFGREALARLAHTFRESVSGWGLDFVWPHLLKYPARQIAILDATPVVHTRARGSGATYKTYARTGVRPRHECDRLLRKYHVRRRPLLSYASLAADCGRPGATALGS